MSFLREQRRAWGRWIVRAGRRWRDAMFGKTILPDLEHPPSRILILRPYFLGDILLCLPMAQEIKRQWPQARISWLLREEWKELLEYHSVVDDVIPFSASRKGLGRIMEFGCVAKQLRERSFDVVFNLSWDRSSILWSWLSGARIRLGIEEYGRPRLLSLLYTATVVSPDRAADLSSMADFYYEPLRLLEFGPRNECPRVTATEAERDRIQHYLSALGNSPLLLVHPGGRLRYKRWAPERFAEFLRKLGAETSCSIVLVCGPSEESWAADLALELPGGRGIFWPRPTLGELMALSQRARLFIGNDSGPMHLAAASGCKVLALFGKDPSRWKPLGPAHILHRPEGLDGISVDEVMSRCREELALEHGKE